MHIIIIFSLLFSFNVHASEQFIKALEQKKWHKADEVQDHDYKILSLWLKLTTEKEPNFYQLINFINKYPHWPKIELLKDKLEQSNFANCKEADILTWFNKNPPRTIIGRKKYIELLKDKQLKEHYIKLVWENSIFSTKDERDFLKKYKTILTNEDYIHRINYLLFNHYTDQAVRILFYIPTELQSLYQIRINLQQGSPTRLADYQKLDKKLQQDIGILHNLAHMYEAQKDEDNLIKTLNLASNIGGKYQFYFWNLKAKLIRNLVQKQDYTTAYLFASSHGHLNTKEYSEAEWLAGWIALRFLNQPKVAITHFNKLYNKVKMPISLARGSYWLARSYEKLNDTLQSEYWYKVTSKYYISFYGQLAICKTNDCRLKIPDDPIINNKSYQLFNNNPLVKAALILNKTRYHYLVQEFLSKAIENSNDYGEITLITKIGFQADRAHLSVEAAKQASYKDIHVTESSYPVLKSIYRDHKVNQALIMALIRQESVFNHSAISSAGAMGLMQIMPHVAKETAKQIKERYYQTKLISDPNFNTKLGISHLEKLLKNYNGSFVLAIAAYNAGDKAASQWIEANGDPRKMKGAYEIIDWMEKITFHETRNYVHRVLEGKSIYNILINKEVKLSILDDLFSDQD